MPGASECSRSASAAFDGKLRASHFSLGLSNNSIRISMSVIYENKLNLKELDNELQTR